jgi:hypothetical protein
MLRGCSWNMCTWKPAGSFNKGTPWIKPVKQSVVENPLNKQCIKHIRVTTLRRKYFCELSHSWCVVVDQVWQALWYEHLFVIAYWQKRRKTVGHKWNFDEILISKNLLHVWAYTPSLIPVVNHLNHARVFSTFILPN